MLTVEGLRAGYHGGTVLFGLSLTVAAGEVYGIVGHNGAGKTTLLHAIAGLVRAGEGRILLGERGVARTPTHRRALLGLGLVPQGRRVFGSLTVAEHLSVAARGGAWTRARVLDLLPRLGERLGHRGGQLSGGEQQMLAFARALLGQPKVLLLDEPTEGLVPALAKQIAETVAVLREEGIAVLVTAPGLDAVAGAADRIAVLTAGRLGPEHGGADVRADPGLVTKALALHASRTEPVAKGAAGNRPDEDA